MNIVKQAPAKHNFYYNVVNNSLMATGFGHKTVFRPHTKNTASYCTRKCMPTFPSQSPVPVFNFITGTGDCDGKVGIHFLVQQEAVFLDEV